MKFIVVFTALFALTVAGPVSQEVEVLRIGNDIGPESHKYSLETSDGVKIESQGFLENTGTDHESYSHRGFYSYVADDGVTYTVTYVADENGFQPSGSHFPEAIHH
ncbi:hypothetical protein ACFFRR_007963 [Megaselia abdita]